MVLLAASKWAAAALEPSSLVVPPVMLTALALPPLLCSRCCQALEQTVLVALWEVVLLSQVPEVSSC